MPKVRFLRDFRSRNTAEQFFELGAAWDATDEQAAGLLAEGAAELVAAPLPAAAPTPPMSAPVEPPPSTGAAPRKAASKRASKKVKPHGAD
jgi:hypothetical protein